MAAPLKYKDTSGNIQTVNIDPTYQMTLEVPTITTETAIEIIDPSGSNVFEFEGSKPKH